jgi:hypothetical protein
MFHGVVANMIQYKFGLYNGEGNLRLNGTDDFLVAGQLRFFFFGYEENKNSFFHVGFLRSRDNRFHAPGNILSASIATPWGRYIYDNTGTGLDATRGSQTGVDVGFRFDQDMENGSNIRAELEFMYTTWERKFRGPGFGGEPTADMPHLEGWGATFVVAYRHCLDPEVKGSGVVPMFKFSYSDIDNVNSDDRNNPGENVLGERLYVFTLGLGYAFNKHVFANFNWVMVYGEERTTYAGAKDPDAAGNAHSGGLEHGWFFQLTAQF